VLLILASTEAVIQVTIDERRRCLLRNIPRSKAYGINA